MKKYSFLVVIMIMAILLGISTIPENPLYNINWAIMSALIVIVPIGAFFWRFEKKDVSSKEIALIATMATLAGVSRIPFAIIMGFQPTTFIVMITGYVFGSQTGFMVGALAALVSNLFLGQGPWTPWQMFCWGLCGLVSAWLGGKERRLNLKKLVILGAGWGYVHGWIMTLWHWLSFIFPLNLKTFIATYIVSFPSDTLHSVGNIIFVLIFSKAFYNILYNFKKKTIIISLEHD